MKYLVCFVLLSLSTSASEVVRSEVLRLDLAPIVTRELDRGKTVIEASLAAFNALTLLQEENPGAVVVLDSSTVPSTPDGSSPAWAAIRAVRRCANGTNVCWKTTKDHYNYRSWTPDERRERQTAPAAAYPDARLWKRRKDGSFGWAERIGRQMATVRALHGETVDLVMVGDSISHFMEGRGGRPAEPWPSVIAFTNGLKVLNLAQGGDRTDQTIWRARYGLLDGYRAKFVSLLIGTNNCSKRDTQEDVVRAITDLLALIRAKQPDATVILNAIWPREYAPDDPKEIKNRGINAEIRKLADGKKVVWVDITDELRGEDGKFRKELRIDLVHPNDAGYAVWLKALRSVMGPSQASLDMDYDTPAGTWNEALPLGNGRIGAMVFGETGCERIQLNEDTVWGGCANNPIETRMRELLPEIRSRIFAGDADDAAAWFRAQGVGISAYGNS